MERSIGAALALALLTSSVGIAQAQPARVLVIFDTSGSMLWDYEGLGGCWGDGSEAYPHRTCELGSKLFWAKDALGRIIAGSPGVEFGLMRYGQLEPGDPGFGELLNQVGAQYRDANGDVVPIHYDGSTPACGPADLLVEAGPQSRPAVLGWMDGRERYPADKELRANGYTPLSLSLRSAREALAGQIADDPESACRAYHVLLLTDGYQQCPGIDSADPLVRAGVRVELVREARALRALNVQGEVHDVRTFVVGFGPGTAFATELDALARAGGTAVDHNGNPDLLNGTAYQANDPAGLAAQLQAAVDNARPRELCNEVDDDCDGQVDEDFPLLGGACAVGEGECWREGRRVCAADGEGVVCSVEPGRPVAERCDGLDNDCDGQVDEGVLNACGDCGPAPEERCNGVDDDCDGAIDEGLLNRCGECGAEPREVCNGRDDDCDGAIDEGVQNACGACGDVPSEICDCEDNDCDRLIDEDLDCPICACDPRPEICDGLDNDCDREIDEGVLNACGRCGAVPEEICNGLDDDCDGAIDESFPEAEQACAGGGLGACAETGTGRGVWICEAGRLRCPDAIEPAPEICDGADNDCDGETDEGTRNRCNWCGAGRAEVCDNIDNDCDGQRDGREGLCRGEGVCINGECADRCADGECLAGEGCVDDGLGGGPRCVRPCRNTDCLPGFVCQDGDCADPCVDIPCLEGTYCALGRCVPDDCYGPAGCPAGAVCRGGRCEPDRCFEAGCDEGQGCVEGRCFDPTCEGCAAGEACVNGACEPDPCARIACEYPLACAGGECVVDPCFEIGCGPGRICVEGGCLDDPCASMRCPEDAACHRGICVGSGDGAGRDPGRSGEEGVDLINGDGGLPSSPDGGGAADDLRITGGSCSCDAAPAGGRGAGLLLLLAVLGLRRRRRDLL